MGNQKLKSLEEVMNALSICGRHSKCCIGCPYQDISYPTRIGNTCKDVLHDDALWYLKNYRSDMQMYAENQKFWEDELKQKIKDFGDAKDRYIARLKELDIGTLSNPLTWGELRSMEGKPVWVDSHCDFVGWAIVCNALADRVHFVIGHYDGNFLTYEMTLPKCTFGMIWQAYRKERG